MSNSFSPRNSDTSTHSHTQITNTKERENLDSCPQKMQHTQPSQTPKAHTHHKCNSHFEALTAVVPPILPIRPLVFRTPDAVFVSVVLRRIGLVRTFPTLISPFPLLTAKAPPELRPGDLGRAWFSTSLSPSCHFVVVTVVVVEQLTARLFSLPVTLERWGEEPGEREARRASMRT